MDSASRPGSSRTAGHRPGILIVRLSALGDVVHGLPLLAVLRDALPGAFIGWAVEPPAAPLLAGHPLLDRVHIAPRRWLRRLSAWPALRAELAGERYDAVIDLQGLSKSALLARWLSGARRRIGFARPDAREIAPFLYTDRVRPPAGLVHVVDRQLRLLEPLGIVPSPWPTTETARFPLPDYADARAAVEDELNRWLGPAPRRPLAVAAAGGGWPAKLWPVERFGGLIAALWRRRGMAALATWHGEAERLRAEAIVAAAERLAASDAFSAGGGDGRTGGGPQTARFRVAPARALPELIETLRAAAVVIGPDSGPLHLAGAVGTPTVGLFGPTRAERTGVYGPAARNRILTGNPIDRVPVDPGRPPPRGQNYRDPSRLAAIGVDEAMAAVESLLDGGRGNPG